MKTCPEGHAYCTRCHAGKTNEHAPGHPPGEARPLVLELSAAEVDLLRRAVRDLRSRSRKSEANLREKFGENAKTHRAHETAEVAGTLLRRVSRLCEAPPGAVHVPEWPPVAFVHAGTGERIRASQCARACPCRGARLETVGQAPGSRWFHPYPAEFLDAFVKGGE